MKDFSLTNLNQFLGTASLNTYARNKGSIEAKELGFTELEYTKGDWRYKDSYTGFFRSWGREVVWHRNIPVWNCLYGGGLIKGFHQDKDFALKTFNFLKKVLSTGDRQNSFQPRGPKTISDGDWKYNCKVIGDITEFRGDEEIKYKNKVVFTHHFFGGLVIDKK